MFGECSGGVGECSGSARDGLGSAWEWALGRRDDFLYAGPMRTLCGSHAGDFGILRPACRRMFGERFALTRDSWGNDSVTQLVLPTICLYFRPPLEHFIALHTMEY